MLYYKKLFLGFSGCLETQAECIARYRTLSAQTQSHRCSALSAFYKLSFSHVSWTQLQYFIPITILPPRHCMNVRRPVRHSFSSPVITAPAAVSDFLYIEKLHVHYVPAAPAPTVILFPSPAFSLLFRCVKEATSEHCPISWPAVSYFFPIWVQSETLPRGSIAGWTGHPAPSTFYSSIIFCHINCLLFSSSWYRTDTKYL